MSRIFTKRAKARKRLAQIEKKEKADAIIKAHADAEEAKRCMHDWVYIEDADTESLIRKNSRVASVHKASERPHSFLDYEWNTAFYNIYLHKGLNPRSIRPKLSMSAHRKVCIECGECHDGIKSMRLIIDEKIDDATLKEKVIADRKELAKKMWKSCEKGVT